MMIRKYMSIIVSGGIALILLVIASFFLFRFQGRYGDVKSELKKANSNIDKLMQRKPFPSEKNVEIEKRNLAELKAQLADIKDWIEKGEIDIEAWRSPTEFQIKLAPKLQALRASAHEAGVDLPEGFSFGFDKYAEGEMPSAADVERLSRQLQMIETLCEIIFEERIENLTEIERQEFDAGRQTAQDDVVVSRGRRGGFGRQPEQTTGGKEQSITEHKDDQGMYAWEEFTVKFQSKERSFWNVLHALSNTNMLISVVDLDFESVDETKRPKTLVRERGTTSLRRGAGFERNMAVPADTGRGRQTPTDFEGGAEPEYLPREERVVAGEGVLNVTMTVNMYRLLTEKTEGEAE